MISDEMMYFEYIFLYFGDTELSTIWSQEVVPLQVAVSNPRKLNCIILQLVIIPILKFQRNSQTCSFTFKNIHLSVLQKTN